MSENPLAELIDKVLGLPRAYRSAEIVGLGYYMKELDHDELMSFLRGLNLRQWKIAWGAGIPGDAYHDAMPLYRALRARSDGIRASDGGGS